MGNDEARSCRLDGRTGWRAERMSGIAYSVERDGLVLEFSPVAIKDETGSFAGLALPTGFGADGLGRIYIVDTSGNRVLRFDLCPDFKEPAAILGRKGSEPGEFLSPRGLALSPGGDLYIADGGNHRVQVVTTKGFVIRSIWGAVDAQGRPRPGDQPGEFLEPWDIALDAGGNVFVADAGNGRIQKFDRFGRFLLAFGKGILSNPRHLAVGLDGDVTIIDDHPNALVFSPDGTYRKTVSDREEARVNFARPPIWIDAAGRIHYRLPDPLCSIFFRKHADPGSEGAGLSAGAPVSGVIPGWVIEDGLLIEKTEGLPAPVKVEPRYLTEGAFYSEALDSGMERCSWHKIRLEAVIPQGTSLRILTATSERERDFLEILDLPDSDWATDQTNADNCLVLSPPGRFLSLRIEWKGNVTATPVLRSILVQYPRLSYLQYLPRIYKEDPSGSGFLERFLSIFEDIWGGLEDRIERIYELFSPAATDKAFLPWLASWLALTIDDKWPEEKIRKLIAGAWRLFQMRGTLRGLQEVLALYSGRTFPIIEHFRLRRWLILGPGAVLGGDSFLWGQESTLGENTQLGGFTLLAQDASTPDPFADRAHRFSLYLPAEFYRGEKAETAIRRIIELWKPAATAYRICPVEAGFRVGVQSLIGLDSYIGKYPLAILGRKAELGRETVLGDRPEERGSPSFVLDGSMRLNRETALT